ncbi:MAG: ATP-binding cassette domain-containing protein [Acetobacteraceae bacterium]|nr:ATP-binding cassette domain-containing protein [Acetobacteraceae bacterium]
MKDGTFELVGVAAGYDGALVLRGFSLRISPGEVVVVAGGDGGGKTTLARVAAGFMRPSGGRVVFGRRDLTGRPTHRFTRSGIVLGSPELINGRLTVLDNLLLAARYGAGVSGSAAARLVASALERFPALAPRTRQMAASLSSGQKVMLGIARALCAAPRLLILDEPAIGLAPDTLARVAEVLKDTAAAGRAALITDTDAGRWGYPAVRLEGRG